MSAVQEQRQWSPERVGRMKNLLPTKNGESITLRHAMRSFNLGKFGRYFHEQVFRYAKRYGLSTDEALKYLGADADPIGHQVVLSERYVPLVIEQSGLSVSDDNKLLLKFVAAFHDIGESMHQELTQLGFTVVGDVPAGEKTDEDRKNERLIRLHFWSEPPFNSLDEAFLDRAEAIISHHPKEGDEYLHELFETAHHLQAFDTAMTAHYSVLHFPELRENSKTTFSLQRLALDVSNSELVELNKNSYIKQMPAVMEANRLAGLVEHSFTLIEHQTVIPPIGSFSTRRCAQLQSR